MCGGVNHINVMCKEDASGGKIGVMCCRLRKEVWQDGQSWLSGSGWQIYDAVGSGQESCIKGLLSDVRMATVVFCSYITTSWG